MRTRDKLKKSAVKSKSAPLLDSYRHVRNKVNAFFSMVSGSERSRFCSLP